jgi:hypothetical protein
MASFAAQLKGKFFGVVNCFTGWASGGAGVDKDTPPEESTKLCTVQQVRFAYSSSSMITCEWTVIGCN